MNYKHLVNGEWALIDESALVDGERVKQEVASGVWAESNFYAPISTPEYKTSNEQITINGNPTIGKQPIYFVANGDTITIVSDIVDNSDVVQTQIDSSSLGYPPILVVPVMKYANKQVVDEVYFQVTLANGVITTTGTLPSAGNWQMKTERVNESLNAINANWKFSCASANFIVS